MRIKVEKGAKPKGEIRVNTEGDSLVGKLIAGTKGKVTIKTPFGRYEPNKKTKKRSK